MDLTTVSGVRAQLETQPLRVAGWQKGRSLEGADSAYRGVLNYHSGYLYHIFYGSSRNNVQKRTNTAERTQGLKDSGVRIQEFSKRWALGIQRLYVTIDATHSLFC